jgi:hypothetical protein
MDSAISTSLPHLDHSARDQIGKEAVPVLKGGDANLDYYGYPKKERTVGDHHRSYCFDALCRCNP